MMKNKKCAYCHKEFNENNKRTAEHIFPKGLIDLYPEQDVSFTGDKFFKDNKGLTIADVCQKCNNEILSELDSYGCNLIKTQFYEEVEYKDKDNTFVKNIDNILLKKWLIKIAYNYLRSKKIDCDFIEPYVLSIVDRRNIPDNIDVFIGLHVNNSPLPDRAYNYMPLLFCENPKLLGNSIQISYALDLPWDHNSVSIVGTYNKILIKLGTAVFYIIFWKENTDLNYRENCYKLLTNKFNFSHIREGVGTYYVKRVSATTNLTLGYGHLLSISAMEQEEKYLLSISNGRCAGDVRKEFEDMRTERDWRAGRLLVEAALFPHNQKVKKEYEEFFGTKL